jgi:hypothetical protein
MRARPGFRKEKRYANQDPPLSRFVCASLDCLRDQVTICHINAVANSATKSV